MFKHLATLTTSALLIGAAQASAAAPAIDSTTTVEGRPATIAITHACGAKRCRYKIATADGEAAAGTDYTPAALSFKRRKGQRLDAQLTVDTIDDQACEPDETFVVQLTFVRNGKTHNYSQDETITDNDCTDGQDPSPATVSAPALPDNSEGTQTSSGLGGFGTPHPTASCATPASDDGSPHCAVELQCPDTATICTASTADTLRGTRAGGRTGDQRVTAQLWAHVATLDGPQPAQNAKCEDWGHCTTAPQTFRLGHGEWLEAECSGSHDWSNPYPGTDRNPFEQYDLSCSIDLQVS
jgi:hypothetical protein